MACARMMTSMTIDEQLTYLTKGCVDVVRETDLRKRLGQSAESGQPLTVKVLSLIHI